MLKYILILSLFIIYSNSIILVTDNGNLTIDSYDFGNDQNKCIFRYIPEQSLCKLTDVVMYDNIITYTTNTKCSCKKKMYNAKLMGIKSLIISTNIQPKGIYSYNCYSVDHSGIVIAEISTNDLTTLLNSYNNGSLSYIFINNTYNEYIHIIDNPYYKGFIVVLIILSGTPFILLMFFLPRKTEYINFRLTKYKLLNILFVFISSILSCIYYICEIFSEMIPQDIQFILRTSLIGCTLQSTIMISIIWYWSLRKNINDQSRTIKNSIFSKGLILLAIYILIFVYIIYNMLFYYSVYFQFTFSSLCIVYSMICIMEYFNYIITLYDVFRSISIKSRIGVLMCIVYAAFFIVNVAILLVTLINNTEILIILNNFIVLIATAINVVNLYYINIPELTFYYVELNDES